MESKSGLGKADRTLFTLTNNKEKISIQLRSINNFSRVRSSIVDESCGELWRKEYPQHLINSNEQSGCQITVYPPPWSIHTLTSCWEDENLKWKSRKYSFRNPLLLIPYYMHMTKLLFKGVKRKCCCQSFDYSKWRKNTRL